MTDRKQYHIEVGAPGAWRRLEPNWPDPKAFYHLVLYVAVARERIGDNLMARVVDDEDNEYALWTQPYKNYAVNLHDRPERWLDDIRIAHGISEDAMTRAAIAWLDERKPKISDIIKESFRP